MYRVGNRSWNIPRWLLLSLTVLLGGGLYQTPAPSDAAQAAGTNVLFILDGSGSMWEKPKGQTKTKIAMAKEKMTELIKELKDTRMGLEVYGHREKGNCEDIEMLVPVGQGNKDTLIQRLQAITPKGQTPITRALERAGATLTTAEDATSIVLISDGKETCGGDPCAAARDLRAKGFQVKVHVVGFNVSTDEQSQLQCIAEAGGGQYFAVQNALELKSALGTLKKEIAPQSASVPPASTLLPGKEDVVRVPTQPQPKPGELRLRLPEGIKFEFGGDPNLGRIYRQEDGKAVESAYRFGMNASWTSWPLPAGTYMLRFGEYWMSGIEVKAGEPTDIWFGAFRLGKFTENTSPSFTVYHQESGKKVGSLMGGGIIGYRTLPVLAGMYVLRSQGRNDVTVVVEVGKTVIVKE